MNTIGNILRLTTYGESHGAAVGGILDGCPAGIKISLDDIQSELDRRKPGQSHITTQRNESDTVEILSGVHDEMSTGTPISFIVRNKDHHSSDYNNLKNIFRPSHADYTYIAKYGIRDHRGGGRSSARETVARVAGGAIAKAILSHFKIDIAAYVSQVGDIHLNKDHSSLDLSNIESNIVRCPDNQVAEDMIEAIENAKKQQDSLGGVITGIIKGVPAGLGEPVFNKLHADLGAAMLGINAVKGFDYGSGFEGTSLPGSVHNDSFYSKDGEIQTRTNNSGGIQGGISNGMDINFRVAFKPIATLVKTQNTINRQKEEVTIQLKGRHDPCVLPRAVPIVEAMAALVIADHLLIQRTRQL
ncbi:chorismate synthase [Halosquirtibacter xylanolyticus]|uniref:chorismate synthase n=1 Tax=Halosquirtibacter xylanolyticus TaxID=3374599 RepID=UPI003748689C|nr:chorismate synthase [Prolixibacteraceae bacterium]